jgi:phloretin hydrolase
MSLKSLFVRMGSVFPSPVTMDDIKKMKRRKLTESEESKPYAKYFHKELAEIPAADLAKVNAGPVDTSLATTVHDRNELMKPGYLDVETGYTVMPDGSGFAATLVKMPGVTLEMLDWWFNWHPLEGLRYAMWCPVAHTDISAKNPARHLDSSGVPLKERNYGTTHYPVEGFNQASSQKVAIEFFSPQDYGLDMDMFKEPNISRAYCANVILNLMHIRFNTFFHAVREVDGGVEYRSRYWVGYTMKANGPVRSKIPPVFKMIDLARNNCLHSLTEYNNLASFLPQLYEEMGGKIDKPA